MRELPLGQLPMQLPSTTPVHPCGHGLAGQALAWLLLLTLGLLGAPWYRNDRAEGADPCRSCAVAGAPCVLQTGISGKVRDNATNLPIAGATVQYDGLPISAAVITASDGAFVIAADLNSTCQSQYTVVVTASAPGYSANGLQGLFAADRLPLRFDLYLDSNAVVTPVATPTPTPTFPPVVTSTPTRTPVAGTPTPRPACPTLFLAGYWTTQLTTTNSANQLIFVAIPNPALASQTDRVEIFINGRPARFALTDDGVNGDGLPGDGLYFRVVPTGPLSGMSRTLLQMRAVLESQEVCPTTWPYLTVGP